jgi:lipopolysaccharide transport system ATP-binding protein
MNVTNKDGRTESGGISSDAIIKLQDANKVDSKLLEWAQNRLGRKNIIKSFSQKRAQALDLSQSEWSEFGDKRIEVKCVTALGIDGGLNLIESGEIVRFNIEYFSTIDEANVTIGIAIYNNLGELIYGTNSKLLGVKIHASKNITQSVSFTMKMLLIPGDYFVTVAVHKGLSHEEGNYHWVDSACHFNISGFGDNAFDGLFNLSAEIELD